MDYQTSLVKKFHIKAGQVAPDKPTIPSLEVRILRAKLILEEAFETIQQGLGLEISHRLVDEETGTTETTILDFDNIQFHRQNAPNLVKIADGCADLRVVVVGTEIACGIDGEATFREVMRSNMTKFIDGHRREDGKWIKGPSYSPANLEQFCKE